MKQNIKEGIFWMSLSFIIIITVGILAATRFAGIDTFPIPSPSRLPQILTGTQQGWFIVLLPIVAAAGWIMYFGYFVNKVKNTVKES